MGDLRAERAEQGFYIGPADVGANRVGEDVRECAGVFRRKHVIFTAEAQRSTLACRLERNAGSYPLMCIDALQNMVSFYATVKGGPMCA